MLLKISPSKRPLPVAKRSSLRNRSYEVEPIPGRKVYPSREYSSEYQQPIRPPPLSDQEAAAFQTSRSVSRYDPAQSPPEIAPENSLGVRHNVLLYDPSQSPLEIAQELSLSDQLPWQTTTSHRSVRASRDSLLAPLLINVCNDVVNTPPTPPQLRLCVLPFRWMLLLFQFRL